MPSSDKLAVQLDGVSKRYFLNPTKPFRLSDVASPRALWHRLRPREHVQPDDKLEILGLNEDLSFSPQLKVLLHHMDGTTEELPCIAC